MEFRPNVFRVANFVMDAWGVFILVVAFFMLACGIGGVGFVIYKIYEALYLQWGNWGTSGFTGICLLGWFTHWSNKYCEEWRFQFNQWKKNQTKT